MRTAGITGEAHALRQLTERNCLKFARSLWSVRVLYICGDYTRYNKWLTEIEEFASHNSSYIQADAHIVRAAKALAKGEPENAIRHTNPDSVRYMQATAQYLRCLWIRDQGGIDRIDELEQELQVLEASRGTRTQKRLVTNTILSKLRGDVEFLKASNAVRECGNSLLSGDETSLIEIRKGFDSAAKNYRDSLKAAGKQARSGESRTYTDLCLLLERPTFRHNEREYRQSAYSNESLSNAYQSLVLYHLGLALAHSGKFSIAAEELRAGRNQIPWLDERNDISEFPYLSAILERDLATVEFLRDVLGDSEMPLEIRTFRPATSPDIASRLQHLCGALELAGKRADQASTLYSHSFDVHPICSAKLQTAEAALERIRFDTVRRIMPEHLAVIGWLPRPDHATSHYDPKDSDLLAALVSTESDLYETRSTDQSQLPHAFKFRWQERTKTESSTSNISPQALEFGGKFVFSGLRDWGSSIPLLREYESTSAVQLRSHSISARGGGYVLSLGDRLHVIDPGYDFVANLSEQNFDINAIESVSTSHDHPDHNSDLARLDDLLYELNRRPKRFDTRSPRRYYLLDEGTAKSWAKRCESLLPNSNPLETTKVFSLSTRPPSFVSMRIEELAARQEMDGVVQKWTVPVGIDYHDLDYRIMEDPSIGDPTISVIKKWWAVKHTIPGALGFSWECTFRPALGNSHRLWKLGYTGDCEFDSKFVSTNGPLDGSDVLILHISQPSLDELISEGAVLKKRHLGFYGALRTVQGLEKRPEVVLLGEFWGGRGDLRLSITSEFRSRLLSWDRANYPVEARPAPIPVLPISQGLHLDLATKLVLCNYCFTRWERPADIELIRTNGPYSSFLYLCRQCRSQVSRSVARG